MLLSVAYTVLVSQSSLPTVLIYQQMAPKQGEVDLNIRWAEQFAESLTSSSKVKPVIWSMTDSTLRQWLDDRTIVWEATPGTDTLLANARKVGASFVIIISGLRTEDSATGALLLFRPNSDRPVWTDTQQFVVKGSLDSTALSFGSNWAVKLAENQFKNFRTSTSPPIKDPNPEVKTPQNPPAEPPQNPPQVADSSRALKQAEDQARRGLLDEAILTLREAIDENPTDPAPRSALVRLYTAAGKHEEAANEAQRLAGLGLESKEYLLAAADMWLEVGRPSDAQNALNEHKARAGDSFEARVLQGRIELAKDQLPRANDSFQAAADLKPNADSLIGLALVAALQGQEDLAKMQLDEVRKLSATLPLTTYRWAMRAVDARLDLYTEQFREVMRYATAKPREPQTLARAAKMEAIARSLAALMDGVVAPNNHSASHDRRRLAHRLLVQAAIECASYARSGDEQAGEDANLSFGEALRQLPLVREDMQREIAGK